MSRPLTYTYRPGISQDMIDSIAATVAATAVNTPNTLVRRGASGEVAVGAATATTGQFSGLLTAQAGVTVAAGPVIDTPAVLTSTAASIAINAAAAALFTHTLTENTTLANATGLVAGMRFRIMFTQHASAAKTLALGSYYSLGNAGAIDFVNVGLSKRGWLDCYVVDATHVDCAYFGGF